MSEIANKIVNDIEAGKLQDAKQGIEDGINDKAAQAVDMKRVEAQVDWLKNEPESTVEEE